MKTQERGGGNGTGWAVRAQDWRGAPVSCLACWQGGLPLPEATRSEGTEQRERGERRAPACSTSLERLQCLPCPTLHPGHVAGGQQGPHQAVAGEEQAKEATMGFAPKGLSGGPSRAGGLGGWVGCLLLHSMDDGGGAHGWCRVREVARRLWHAGVGRGGIVAREEG